MCVRDVNFPLRPAPTLTSGCSTVSGQAQEQTADTGRANEPHCGMTSRVFNNYDVLSVVNEL